VHHSKIGSRMTAVGRVSRVSPVQTALRNCTRDEGRSLRGSGCNSPGLLGNSMQKPPTPIATLPLECSKTRRNECRRPDRRNSYGLRTSPLAEQRW
jgi:hypothetical protein